MLRGQSRRSRRLTDDELRFLQDGDNWIGGPTFDIRFICDQEFDFAFFEQALRGDPLHIEDDRYDKPMTLAFWYDDWPKCVGAYFYDFERPGRREPSLVFYPSQYRSIGGENFEYGRFSDSEKRAAAGFLLPLVEFAYRVKGLCGAREVLLFLEDSFPRRSSNAEIRPGVYLAENLLKILT